ncbi:hypothetical protein EI94DRAFT_520208 [Lactarius quietus]|nr:hypothetical protein EI94DRAFT_520208 [Lactarius quietus]
MLNLQYPGEVAVAVAPVMPMPMVIVMVVVTPNIVLVLAPVPIAANVGPTAPLPTGTTNQATVYASPCPNLNESLIPAKHKHKYTPQVLESVYSVSLVWETSTVTLTSMVVPRTIAGGQYANIKIGVELNRVSLRFITSQGPHRARVLRQKQFLSGLRYQLSRVAVVLPRNFSFHLINPRRLPRAASSESNFQTAAWAHLPHAAPQEPSVSHGQVSPACIFPCIHCI